MQQSLTHALSQSRNLKSRYAHLLISSNMALYQILFNVYGHIFIAKVFGGCHLATGGATTTGDWIF
jgi:hypothetical protein